MLQQLQAIRLFEHALLALKGQGLVHGPVHSSCGQEAVAVGVAAGLNRGDKVFATHRAHHHALAALLTTHTDGAFDPLTQAWTEPMQECVTRLMAEIMGLANGYVGGRGGSMHLREPECGLLGTSAIVGGGVPIAGGAAWAERFKRQGSIVVCFFGDGALGQGCVYEAVNLAAIHRLPIIYVIENNLYAVATSVEEAFGKRRLAQRLAGFGLPATVADGMDAIAMKTAIETVAQAVRTGAGPAVIEAQTYRNYHHAGDFPGSAFGYRTKSEEQHWKKQDPILTLAEQLIAKGLLNQEENAALHDAAKDAVDRAVASCTEETGGARVIRESLWPRPETVTQGVRSNGNEFAGIRFVEREAFADTTSLTYVEAIAAVTGRWLERDPTVFVMGEEVSHMGGGAYRACKGLVEKYPDRIISTPISEAGFVGLGAGAAMSGMRPIIEIMFGDFALVAADQLLNHVAQLRYMFGGSVDVPLVIRTRTAVGCGYGAQHSMDPVGFYSLFPGWQIVAPTNAFDYIGLFNSAMVGRNPVVIIEHHSFYEEKCEVPAGDLDYFVQFGRARTLTAGEDITLVSYEGGVRTAMTVAENLRQEGIGVEVVDLRTLDFAGIDFELIARSVSKTGALAILEESPKSRCIGPRIAHEIQGTHFDALDSPVQCIGAHDVPMPVSRVLEKAALPDVARVTEVVRSAAAREC